MSDASPERHWSALFAATAGARAGEPGWLEAARKSAIARFAELGFPTRRDEAWKYTNPTPIAKVAWEDAPAAVAPRDVLAPFPVGDDPALVFVNGRFAGALSSNTTADPALVVAPFSALAASDSAALEAIVAGDAGLGDRAFAALARAFAPDGAFVRVPRGHAAARPIWLFFVTVPGAAPAASHPRFAAIVEQGAQAAIHEVHVGAGDGAALVNALGEIRAEANAQVRHLKLAVDGAGTTHLGHLALHLARDARARTTLVSLGAGVARHDLLGVLEGPGAECAIDGLTIAAGAQHVDCQTTIDHREPHGTSRELVKSVLAGRARGAFAGKVIVRPNAQKSDAQQRNENLLLSRDAQADAKPQLEIEADDVRCTHGSTIGQLDEDAVFYLRSRGLGPDAATALLLRAFAAQVLEPIEHAPTREAIEARVVEKLFAGATS